MTLTMIAASVLLIAACAFLALKGAVLAVNAVAFPRLRAGAAPRQRPRVALIVPVRDEAEQLPATLPGLLAQPAAAIVIVDDGSEDGSAAIVRDLAGHDPRVRLVAGRPLPDGWVGKAWACQQGADTVADTVANAEVLLFTDADVRWRAGALDAFLAVMEAEGAQVASVFPRQRPSSWQQRTLLPLIDDVLLSLLPYPLLRRDAPAAASTANGQAIAFRSEAYRRLGGHEAVRSAMVEDVALARAARRARLRLALALGRSCLEVRMYLSDEAMRRGLAKSLLAAHGGSRALLAASALWHLAVYTAPLALLPLALLGAVPLAAWWALPLAAAAGERIAVNALAGRGAYGEALLMPLAAIVALPAYGLAAAKTRDWKGRRYRT